MHPVHGHEEMAARYNPRPESDDPQEFPGRLVYVELDGGTRPGIAARFSSARPGEERSQPLGILVRQSFACHELQVEAGPVASDGADQPWKRPDDVHAFDDDVEAARISVCD